MSILEKIQSEWEKDSVVDKLDLTNEATRVPQIHAKYLNFFRQVRTQLISFRKKKAEMSRDKFMFYSGKADPQVYAKERWDHKVLRGDLDVYVKSDKDVISLDERIAVAELAEEMLKQIFAQLKDRTWQIRSAIDFQRMLNGA